MEQIKISGLNFSYPNSDYIGLKDINLSIYKGDFILLFGRSGCGKSTFLKQLKPVIAPFGKLEGSIEFCGKDIKDLSDQEQSRKIGFVSQNADNQIVTDKVWHELAFGLESLGYNNKTIRLRVAEMASFFGIQDWFLKPVTDLSGGQRQILNLASVMVMQPEVLLLDEPTSQLDPIATSNFIQMLKKINDELGVTIVISEHHLEEVLPVSSRVTFMDEGKLLLDCKPREIGSLMKKINHDMYEALPTSVKIYSEFCGGDTPITVKEAKEWINEFTKGKPKQTLGIVNGDSFIGDNIAVELDDVWFKYDKKSEDIVKGISLKVKQGTLYSIVGGNGVGKSTLISLIGGVNKPYRGKVKLLGQDLTKMKYNGIYRGLIGYLPQDPQCLFVRNTVLKDLEEMAGTVYKNKDDAKKHLDEVIVFFRLEPLLNRHPFDLSGGEQQCAALAKVMLTNPSVILLDEPTKGIDSVFKKKLSNLFESLKKQDKTVIMVSHDIDFCASYSDYCALMFNGEIISDGNTKKFFMGNSFYTTSSNRISRGVFQNAFTCEDVIRLCQSSQIKG
jgi:ATPase components of various ABC-type transport systems, contain duplicated ATPase